MATTVVFEDELEVSRSMIVDNRVRTVERVTFGDAVGERDMLQSLVAVMSAELIERNIISRCDNGTYQWKLTREPLVEDERWID